MKLLRPKSPASAIRDMKGRAPILLCPGPVMTSPMVQRVMTEDHCHRDRSFLTVLDQAAQALRRIADAPDHEALLLGTSGSGAIEAILTTFVPSEEEMLVVSNGGFGERMADIARVLGLRVRHHPNAWAEAITVGQIEVLLDSYPGTRWVAIVHHETSVGRLNPVQPIGDLLKRRGIRYIVDVVSSLGAEEFSAAATNAALVIGSANKCLHGVPGVAFVLVRDDLWRISEQIPPRSYYLDLRRYRAAFKEGGQTPFTPPVPAILALKQSLVELEEQGGPPARRHRYLELNRIIRASLRGLGFDTLVNGDEAPCSLTAVRLPEGRDFDDIQRSLWHKGFVVYEAKGPLKKSHFLIANMGELEKRQIESFVETLAQVVGPALVPAGSRLLSS